MTRCNLLPVLTGTEALFTFCRLILVPKLLRVTPGEFISNVSDRISVTWMPRLTLTSWIFDGAIDRVTLSSSATPTSVTYFIPIDLNGVDNRTRAICFLPDLSPISTSRAPCAYLAIEPFLLDIYHRMLDRRKISSTLMSSFNFLSTFSCCRAVVWLAST